MIGALCATSSRIWACSTRTMRKHHHGASRACGLSERGDEDRHARMLRLWNESQPVASTIAERYLRGRAIEGELQGPTCFGFILA